MVYLNNKIDLNKDANNEKITTYMEMEQTKKPKQTKGVNRNTIDKYYTKNAVVDSCVELVKKYIQINSSELIIEPSAGNGSFISAIKGLTNNHLFYDLEPENEEIVKQDYLQFNYTDVKNKFERIHIIGNPPFGRQSSLAIKFIKKSCEFCSSISFILPKSFKKDSLKKTFPLNFHLIYETDLPNKSFLVNGSEHNVPCIFQIWEKKTHNRDTIDKLEPIHFKFVKKDEFPDISFIRVGGKAGTVDKNTKDKGLQAHYFIKFTNNNASVDENIQKLSTITYEFNNTVGPRSISKQELIKEFNKVL
jgi:predicted RNA methylase